MISHFGDSIVLLFLLSRTHLQCGCQLMWKMSIHYSNTDMSIDGCETPLEGSNQVQNASQATRNQLEPCYVENVHCIDLE